MKSQTETKCHQHGKTTEVREVHLQLENALGSCMNSCLCGHILLLLLEKVFFPHFSLLYFSVLFSGKDDASNFFCIGLPKARCLHILLLLLFFMHFRIVQQFVSQV